MRILNKILCLTIFLFAGISSFAQIAPPANRDTVKEFEIIRGPSMRTVEIDSLTTLQTIAGGAIVKQGTTTFSSDSAVINPVTHVIEAFGNVHINQADSVQTYGQYLKYIGTEKTAYLKRSVRLTDKKGTLFTDDLDYNLNTGIGNYHNGGKVIDKGNTITSKEGTYYADTKDVYFRNDVKVIGPKNRITADSLIYNMYSEVVSFTGNTNIKNKEVDINTTQGTYDLKTGNAFFTSRTAVQDSSGRVYVANNMALEDKSGNAQLEGNAVIKDSANGLIVTANQIFLNKKNNSFLATRKPVMIIIQKNDSTYVTGDTLFSGYTTSINYNEMTLKKDSATRDTLSVKPGKDSLTKDTLQVKTQQDSVTLDSIRTDLKKNIRQDSLSLNIKNDTTHVIDTSQNYSLNRQAKFDTLPKAILIPDSAKAGTSPLTKNSVPRQLNAPNNDSLNVISQSQNDSLQDSLKVDAGEFSQADSVRNNLITANAADSVDAGKKDSIRYFIAFHHVKIFNDSLQSMSDSLFFSTKDSIFRLYYDPVIWSGGSQITGDTIFLYTKNKKADRLFAFERSMVVNKTNEGFFNQMAGKTLNGYFIDGKIDYMRVKGSQSESIYYARDDDSAYIGMNRALGDVIDLYFKKGSLNKVLFVNDVKGKMYPMREIPAEEKVLKNFIWLDDKRPKNKLELFE
ncbi:MAG: OstA-like protein [Ginsengibacter sp.]